MRGEQRRRRRRVARRPCRARRRRGRRCLQSRSVVWTPRFSFLRSPPSMRAPPLGTHHAPESPKRANRKQACACALTTALAICGDDECRRSMLRRCHGLATRRWRHDEKLDAIARWSAKQLRTRRSNIYFLCTRFSPVPRTNTRLDKKRKKVSIYCEKKNTSENSDKRGKQTI